MLLLVVDHIVQILITLLGLNAHRGRVKSRLSCGMRGFCLRLRLGSLHWCPISTSDLMYHQLKLEDFFVLSNYGTFKLLQFHLTLVDPSVLIESLTNNLGNASLAALEGLV